MAERAAVLALMTASATFLMLAGYALGTGRGFAVYAVLCVIGLGFGLARDLRLFKRGVRR